MEDKKIKEFLELFILKKTADGTILSPELIYSKEELEEQSRMVQWLKNN